MFSRACEYGIRAMIYISHETQAGRRVNVRQVAEAIQSPVAFTGKILQSLVNNKILESTKGLNGGYEIPESRLRQINIFQIVRAIDGDGLFKSCGLGLKSCNAKKPCPLHYRFKEIRDDLIEMLTSTSIYDLANNLDDGLAFLKR